MPLYEKRTYQAGIGKMPELLKLEADVYAVLEAEGFSQYLVGYFTSDTGPLHQLIHIWRFDDDAARRDFWKRLYASEAFMAIVAHIRPLLESQEVQLMNSAPFGPAP
jgi:hypothetical protein